MTYKHLSNEERYSISILRRKGDSCPSIATTLDRSVSTIRRQLKRNSTDKGGYHYKLAHKLATRRSVEATYPSSSICEHSSIFTKKQIINEQWSSEQTAGELIELEMKPSSHETIYKRIY